MTGHVPLDYEAVRFRADLESMRDTAAKIFGHPNRENVSAVPIFCDMEEQLWFETGICTSPALWPTDIAAQVIRDWKTAS